MFVMPIEEAGSAPWFVKWHFIVGNGETLFAKFRDGFIQDGVIIFFVLFSSFLEFQQPSFPLDKMRLNAVITVCKKLQKVFSARCVR